MTGAAARAMDAKGQFVLAAPAASSAEIDGTRARELAETYMHQFGRFLRRALEKDRGGPIDIDHLQACGRAYYAATTFEPLPSDIPQAAHRNFGSWWLVGLCAPNGDLQVSVAVSALTTELTIANGAIDFSRSGGQEFFPLGVPPSWDAPVGFSPERAAERSARASHKRIADVPVLIAPDPGLAYPQGAVWQLRLDAPVKLRGAKSSRVLLSDSVFVGLHADAGLRPQLAGSNSDEAVLLTPSPTQPEGRPFTYGVLPPGADVSTKPELHTGTVHRRPGIPMTYERLTVQEP